MFSYKDVEEAIDLYTNDTTIKYFGGSISVEAARVKLNKSMVSRKILHLWKVNYTVSLKESRELIGIINISPYHNFLCNKLSYQFKPDFCGKGYAYEDINELVPFCKSYFGLGKLVSQTHTRNIKSCRLLEKLGFKLDKKLVRFGQEQSVYKLRLH